MVWVEVEVEIMGSLLASVKEGNGRDDPLETSLDSIVTSIGSEFPTETSVEEILED